MKYEFDKLTEAQKQMLAMSTLAPWHLNPEARLRWIEARLQEAETESEERWSPTSDALLRFVTKRYEALLDEFDEKGYVQLPPPPAPVEYDDDDSIPF